MGLGVLEVRTQLEKVPGTVLLTELDAQHTDNDGQLKRGSGRHRDIILAPQPSDDPNDPLNWSYYKKLTIMSILVLGACLNAATVGPLLGASVVVLSEEFNRPLVDITLLTGYTTVVAGVSCPFTAAMTRKYGKRPILLFSSFACLVGSIIGSTSHSYNTLLAGRIIQGLGIAAYESLPFTVVGDIFYVHERGLWINVVSFALGSVSNLCSVITGPVTFTLGWHYLFHLLVACSGFQTLLIFIFVPETCYLRHPYFNQHLAMSFTNTAEESGKEAKHNGVVEHLESTTPTSRPQPPPAKTFWNELVIYTGSYSDESLIKLVFAPFLCLTNIAALWTVVVTGVITSFYVAMSYVMAQLFSPPPYLLSTAEVGYLSVGPFLGGIIGSVFIAMTADALAIWMAKRNKGVYEPEFRLPLALLGLLCTAGLFGFGGVSQARGNIYLIVFMWGLAQCGISCALGPYSSYALDAFRGMSNEIFVANVMFKNFLFFGYSYFINDWVASAGAAGPFYIFGGISAALILVTVAAYMFGKRYRALWDRYNVMEKLNIRTHSEI